MASRTIRLSQLQRRTPSFGGLALVLVALGVAALSVSATATHYSIDVTSSASGTVDIAADWEPLEVTITLQEAITEPLNLVLVSMKRDSATLVVDGTIATRHQLELTVGGDTTISYQVKPLAPGTASIAWYVSGRNRGVHYHVYQVRIPEAPVDQTEKTKNNVRIGQRAADPWSGGLHDGYLYDHVIGDSSSVTYEVSLDAVKGTCLATSLSPATVEIAVAAFHLPRMKLNDLKLKDLRRVGVDPSGIGVFVGDGIPATRSYIGTSKVTFELSNCTDTQLVTVYGMPELDMIQHVVTLSHTVRYNDSTTADGPTLTLWMYDAVAFRLTASRLDYSGSAEPVVNAGRVGPGHGSALRVEAYPPSAEGARAEAWWEGCGTKDFEWERYCPPASSKVDVSPWVEFCIKIAPWTVNPRNRPILLPWMSLVPYSSQPPTQANQLRFDPTQHVRGPTATGRALPFEFQIYTDFDRTVNTIRACQPTPADGTDHWKTFYDGAAHADRYQIGTVGTRIPQSALGKFINIRVRGAWGIGPSVDTDGNLVKIVSTATEYHVYFRLDEVRHALGTSSLSLINNPAPSDYPHYNGPQPTRKFPTDDCTRNVQSSCTIGAPASVGGETSALGDILLRNDYDWFRVLLRQGQEYRVRVAGHSGSAPLNAIRRVLITLIYDADGVPLEHAGGWLRTESDGYSFGVGADGDYYIEVTHGPMGASRFESAYSGAYQLSLTRTK